MTSYCYSILHFFHYIHHQYSASIHLYYVLCFYPLHNDHKASAHLVLCQVLFHSLAPSFFFIYSNKHHRLSCRPLVFLLPKHGTTGSSGIHTCAHLPPSLCGIPQAKGDSVFCAHLSMSRAPAPDY